MHHFGFLGFGLAEDGDDRKGWWEDDERRYHRDEELMQGETKSKRMIYIIALYMHLILNTYVYVKNDTS